MNATTVPEPAEANDILTARADERLSHAYEQIARADEQLARLTEQLSRMEQDAARQPAVVQVTRPSRDGTALRGFIGLLAATCIIGGAFASQSSWGEAVKPTIVGWAAPYATSISRLVRAAPEPAAQPNPPGMGLAAAEAAAPLAAPPVQTMPQDTAAATAAPASPDLAKLLQTMARDLATVQQGIDDLKAGQARIVSDNARVAEQFKASQEQLARLVAKPCEQDLRARVPAPAPKPVAEPAPKPAPVQARAQPMQLQPATR